MKIKVPKTLEDSRGEIEICLLFMPSTEQRKDRRKREGAAFNLGYERRNPFLFCEYEKRFANHLHRTGRAGMRACRTAVSICGRPMLRQT